MLVFFFLLMHLTHMPDITTRRCSTCHCILEKTLHITEMSRSYCLIFRLILLIFRAGAPLAIASWKTRSLLVFLILLIFISLLILLIFRAGAPRAIASWKTRSLRVLLQLRCVSACGSGELKHVTALPKPLPKLH